LEGGRIVEHGTHDQLIKEDGLYVELFTLQAAAYLEEAAAEDPARLQLTGGDESRQISE
jgi:ATP-binding cassette, subfamily B, bacterial